jgi:hypothetical protein
VFAPGKPFQAIILFVSKARSLPHSGAHDRCFTWVSYCLTQKHFAILERLVKDKLSYLLRKLVIYVHKKFNNIGPRLKRLVRDKHSFGFFVSEEEKVLYYWQRSESRHILDENRQGKLWLAPPQGPRP